MKLSAVNDKDPSWDPVCHLPVWSSFGSTLGQVLADAQSQHPKRFTYVHASSSLCTKFYVIEKWKCMTVRVSNNEELLAMRCEKNYHFCFSTEDVKFVLTLIVCALI